MQGHATAARPGFDSRLGLVFLGLLLARFCHLNILWVEEAYPTAAAIQLLKGKSLYSGIWFDKPPLFPYLYLLWGARIGLPLRIAGASFVFLCCFLIYRFATELWSIREGLAAAYLLAFYLTFGIPSAVMALAPDLLMVAPHIGAMYLAWRGRPWLAGFTAGVAMLVNPKAVYVLAACLLWRWREAPKMVAAFLIPNILAFAWFGRPYYEEVWQWGAVYARHGFPLLAGFTRTLNWTGFHSAAVVAAAWCLWKERSWRMLGWAAISLAAVAAGWRFFPRYYFHLLVPVTVMASRGIVLLGRRRAIIYLLLAIPLLRFGPRYAILASDLVQGRPHAWADLAMNQASQRTAEFLRDPKGTLLVWGYRPDIFAYTRMEAGTRFLDSQPLTGVIADRHLTDSEVQYPELAANNRRVLTAARPNFVVDGLGLYNPSLAITNYPDLREWLWHYHEIGRTESTVIYELNSE
jgi:hypothetical protein